LEQDLYVHPHPEPGIECKLASAKVLDPKGDRDMAIYSLTLVSGGKVPAAGVSIGGGLVAAIHIPTGGDSSTYQCQYSPDGGTTWDPCTDEGGNIVTITYVVGGAMHQINPPVRAPLFRIVGVSADETGNLVCEVHTV